MVASVAVLLVTACPRSVAAAERQSFAATNAPVRLVLLDLAKRFGASIALPDDLHGSVTVSLHSATLDQALTAVLTPLGYAFGRKSGVIVVSRVTGSTQGAFAASRAPMVLSVTYIMADRAAKALHDLFPDASLRVDHGANAVIVVAATDDLQAMRNVLQSLDVRSPLSATVEALSLRSVGAEKIVARLKVLYPQVQFSVVSKQSLLVRATPADITQIRALVSALDAPTPLPTPQPGLPTATEGMRVMQGRPADIARAVSHDFPRLRVGVSGTAVVLSGSPEDVAKAKTLISQVDLPPVGTKVTQVYRIRTVDAGSVGDLIARSFANATITVDRDLNALSVTSTTTDQQRIADAIAQLDGNPSQQGGGQPGSYGGINQGASNGSSFEIVSLRSAVPNQGSAGSIATDSASAQVIQTLQQLVPGVRVSALSTPGQIALIGDPYSLRLAKQFLAKLDVPAPLVVLDTEVLEIDESAARNLGLLLSQPVISTTFSEIAPPADLNTGVSRLIGIGAITRTPLSLTAQLNLQIQNGTARVLADPRITTISGHTATIRAGDTIGILTTTGGGAGTYATSQIQTFQTGVTLDITPIVTPDDEVTVALHPIVNSLSGILNGVPQISTRDTQTTVHLKNNQTLIIGGLIQESSTHTENKIPLLGDVPLVGHIFRNVQSSSTRNELIIVVTPHVLAEGESAPIQGPPLPTIPTPAPLPTLPPGTRLSLPTGQLPGAVRAPSSSRAGGRTAVAVVPSPSPAPSAAIVPAAAAVAGPGLGPIGTAPPANAISYGQIPPSNAAALTDPARVFFVSISPARFTDGASMSVRAVTTTNVSRALLTLGSFSTTLTQTGPGQWTAAFPFSASYASGQSTLQATVYAARGDGSSASINVMVPLGS